MYIVLSQYCITPEASVYTFSAVILYNDLCITVYKDCYSIIVCIITPSANCIPPEFHYQWYPIFLVLKFVATREPPPNVIGLYAIHIPLVPRSFFSLLPSTFFLLHSSFYLLSPPSSVIQSSSPTLEVRVNRLFIGVNRLFSVIQSSSPTL